MKCVIPAVNIKAFGKAIQSLAKIGDEISIEPTFDGLQIKSLNSSRSCLALFEFKPRFFQHYDDGSPRPVNQNTPRFRILAKSALSVFKSLNTLEKLVEKCTISLNENQTRVVFSMCCKHGITKTYNFTYMESDPLECSLSKSACSNIIKGESKIFADILLSFPTNLEEMTMLVTAEKLSLRNFVNGEVSKDPMKSLNTVMTLDQEEFEVYNILGDTSISFCVKEVKAALAFAEYIGSTITLHFDTGGKPMFICIDSDPNYIVTFIASTVSEDLSQSSTEDPVNTNTSPVAASRSDKRSEDKLQKERPFKGLLTNSSVTGESDSSSMIDKYLAKKSSKKPDAAPDDRRQTEKVIPRKAPESHRSVSNVEVKPRISELMSDSSITLLPEPKSKHKNEIDALLEEIDKDCTIPANPAPAAKSLFFNRSSAKATHNPPKEVLVDDSDEDT